MIRTITVNLKKFISVLICFIIIVLGLPIFTAMDVSADNADGGSGIIVSLGDSYSAGEGIEKFYFQDELPSTKTKKHDWLAHRSTKSWSSRLKLNGESMIRNDNWYFVAASGAVTDDLKNEQYKSYNKFSLTFDKFGIPDPDIIDHDWLDPQLDIFDELKSNNQEAEYVTLTLGGNDAKFTEVVTTGVKNIRDGWKYFNPGKLNNELNKIWEEFYNDTDNDADNKSIRDNLYQAYYDISAKAGPQAKIIVAGYPKLIDPEGSKAFFSKNDATLINDSVSRFNKEINAIVQSCKNGDFPDNVTTTTDTNGNIVNKGPIKICFVSVEEGFDEGGGHAAYSSDPYINKVMIKDYYLGLTDDLVDPGNFTSSDENGKTTLTFVSSYSMHPNDSGAQVYADCVQAKIDQIEKDGGKSEWPTMSTSDERDIVLVLDVSGSMSGTPMEETKIASEKFVETILKEDASIGVVTYDDQSMCISDFSMNETYLTNVVQQINSGGGTNIEAGLSKAYDMLKNKSSAKKKIIVLMSDGQPNEGLQGDELIEYANSIKEEGIYIYTLGFFQSLGSSAGEAQKLMTEIASPNCYYDVPTAEDLVFFFGDIADQLNGQKYIYVRIACPVDVTVRHNGQRLSSKENRLSTRTDFGSLSFEQNEDSSDTDSNDQIKVLRLKEGTDYEIEIEGYARGKMDYTIGFMDENGEYSDMRKFNNIKITKNTVIDTIATNSDETYLNVDQDGDGEYDIVYRATANGRAKVVDNSYIIYIIIGVSVLILVIIAFVVIKSKKNKKISN